MASRITLIAFGILINICARAQDNRKFDLEITNATYFIGQGALVVDMIFENKTRDTVYVVNPNHYFANQFVKHLVQEPYAINVYLNNECQTCSLELMKGDAGWFKDFTRDYVLAVPPKKRMPFSFKTEYEREFFTGNGAFSVKLDYAFSNASYKKDDSNESVNAILRKVALLERSETASVIVK